MSNRLKPLKYFMQVLLAMSPVLLSAQLQVNVSVKQPSCNGYTNGEASAAVSGGTSPYTYNWSNGQHGSTVFGIAAGSYKLTVSDAGGQSVVKDVTVGQPDVLVLTATQTTGSCETTINYAASAAGGTRPYSFSWKNLNNGQTTSGAFLVNAIKGSYLLEVKDANGCISSKVINVNGPLEVTLKLGDAVCGGTCDGVAEAIVTGGTEPYKYLWSYNGATTPVLFPIPGGNYTVTVTDAAGCQRVASGFVFEPEPLKVNLTTSNTCSGNASASVNPTGGRLPYKINWSNGATGNSVSGLAQGVYFVTVTDAFDCKMDARIDVSNTAEIKPFITKTDITCSGVNDGSVTAHVTGIALGPYTYKWNNGATTQTLTNVAAGNYTVTITDGAGCMASTTTTVNAQKNLVITTTTVNAFCGVNGSATVATVTGGTAPFSYKWSNGATSQTASNLNAGNYVVTVQDAQGCTATNNVTINGVSSGNLTLVTTKEDATCNGLSTGKASVSVNGGSGTYTYKWSNGATTPSVSGLPAGNYTVSVTAADGCVTTANVAINNQKDVSLTTTKVDAVCGLNGSSTVTAVNNGIGPFTFKWSDGQTTQTALNLKDGVYGVSVTDAIGCVATSNVTISNSASLHLTSTTVDASCNGVANGRASVAATGVPGPYTYKWSNGQNTESTMLLPAGKYTVTVSAAGGCQATLDVLIKNQKDVSLTTTKVDAVCGINGASTVTAVNNGVGPFTFKWSNGATTQTASGLTNGNYTVTVTDAAGCVATSNVTILNSTNIKIAITKEDATCNGINDGKATATVTGATGAVTYKWSTGATTPSVTGLAAGTYTLSVTGDNCTEIATVTINNGKTITLTTATTPTLCGSSTGSASVITATGGTAPYSYKWSNGATTASAGNLGEGTYSVTVTDAQGCQAVTNNVAVKVEGNPIKTTYTIVNAKCGQANGSVFIDAQGGKPLYTFKLGSTTNNTGFFDKLSDGTYTVSITDANGCSRLDTFVIKMNGVIKPNFTVAPLSCAGNTPTYQFTNKTTGATDGAVYKWTFSNGQTSSALNPEIAFNTPNATATLVVQSQEGCVDSFKQTFPVNLINVNVPDTAMTCLNTDVTVKAQNNTTFDVSYQWTPTGSITSGDKTASPVLKANTLGKSKVFVDITNAIGCKVRDSVILNVIEKTAADPNKVTYTQACNARTIQFTNTNSNANMYRWVFGDPANPTAGSTDINPSYTYGNAGQYTVTLIPTVACLDTVKKVITVTNPAPVAVAARDTNVCNDNSLVLTANTAAGNTVVWSTSPTFTNPVSGNTFSVNPTNRTNTYYVRATDANGCTGVDTVIVTNNKIQLQYTKAVDVCKGVAKQLTITNLTPDNVNVTWSPSGVVTGTGLTPTINTSTDGTVVATFTNQVGCTLRDTFTVKTHEVDAKAAIDQTVIYANDEVKLSSTPGSGNYTYRWIADNSNANITGTGTANTTAKPQSNTAFTVEITDQFGCKDTATVRVTVLTPECSEPYIFIPRAFSPDNGDELNDKVYVRGEFLTEVEFAIYTRWGELVFKTNNLETGWDGTHKGKAVNPDVYGYYVKGRCKDGQNFFKKGNITVLK